MGKRPYSDYENATPTEVAKQFMIVISVKFLLDECAKDCPQRFDCEDGAFESCCMAYKCGLGNTGFADTCDRCDRCIHDFGTGEQQEEPAKTRLRKYTPHDPIFYTSPCPKCGQDGDIDTSAWPIKTLRNTVLVAYWCRNQECDTTSFNEECRA